MNLLLLQRLHARSRLFYLFVGLILFLPRSGQAQKVAYYDYADVKPAERLRPPLPPPVHPGEFVAGVCSGILQNSPLKISIVSLDRESYAFGDEFTFVLQVEATYATHVPVRISLADLQPADPSITYVWQMMGVTMELHSPKNRTIWVGLLQLYGSKDVPGSEIELNAGEWIELRGKARMAWTNPAPNTLQPGEEKWVIRLPLQRTYQFSAIALAHRAGSKRYDALSKQENQLCDYPGEQSNSGPPVQVTVIPKRSGPKL